MIVVDSWGECGDQFQCPFPLGSRTDGVGLARLDGLQRWRDIIIPVGLVSKRDGERLGAAMGLRAVEVPRFGFQLLNPEAA